MKKLIIALIPVIFLLSGCGNSFRVYHDLDPEADFSQYSTYSFMDWSDGNKKTITGMELERIRASFARELEKKGLAFKDAGADLQVKITVYFREAKSPQYGPIYPDYHFYHPFHYSYPYPSTYNFIERALVVDIYDTSNNRHVWNSAAVGEVGRSPEIRAEDLPKQVARMIEELPVGKSI
ncbi:MAG: DUF4136 domain-containing protein [Bacteroidales bacterium]